MYFMRQMRREIAKKYPSRDFRDCYCNAILYRPLWVLYCYFDCYFDRVIVNEKCRDIFLPSSSPPEKSMKHPALFSGEVNKNTGCYIVVYNNITARVPVCPYAKSQQKR